MYFKSHIRRFISQVPQYYVGDSHPGVTGSIRLKEKRAAKAGILTIGFCTGIYKQL